MDIKEYIQSGIIEQYVLGLANPEEVAELELLRNEYPELSEAISNFERIFEKTVRANQLQPPSFIKASLEKQLFGDDHSGAIVIENAFAAELLRKSRPGVWKYLAAACIVLLVVSTALNFYFYSGYKNSQEQYEALLTERNTLQANNASYQQGLKMFQDSAMKRIEMKGTPGNEQNVATVLWNQNSKQVYIYASSMVQIPTGKQYQLWAIVDGKPVDAGLITDCIGLCKMNRIDHAEAFAITLENAGGSSTPTLTEMYVFGKI
ncbi:MAG TPA: anti-sigma factor [Parafilimonas sp.]|nr:anti-sigma factor [Parafilimonas sp.]